MDDALNHALLTEDLLSLFQRLLKERIPVKDITCWNTRIILRNEALRRNTSWVYVEHCCGSLHLNWFMHSHNSFKHRRCSIRFSSEDELVQFIKHRMKS